MDLLLNSVDIFLLTQLPKVINSDQLMKNLLSTISSNMTRDSVVELEGFKDILVKRSLGGNFSWASREWIPVSAFKQYKNLNPKQIMKITSFGYELQSTIKELSNGSEINIQKLHQKAYEILKEIGYQKMLPVLRWLALITNLLLRKLYSQVLVNEAKLLEIKKRMGNNPLLFLPSHRSYADFILMSYICFHYDIDIPKIAAGMDFQSMTFMGRILRNCCAFFMRRSFNNDKLYTATFKEYVNALVTHGESSVEFFIEGTRSRTLKSLAPKFGLLTMCIKPYLIGSVPEISIVPVNLNYDCVMEELLHVYELLGIPKPKESTAGFWSALRTMKNNYGNIYVHFGDPLSVRNFFENKIDRSIHNFGPLQMQEVTPSESKEIRRLGYAIVRQQMDLTVVTTFNLVAAVINNHVMNCKNSLSFDDLASEVRWLLKVVTSAGAKVALKDYVTKSVETALDLHKNFVFVTSDRTLKLLRIHSENKQINRRKVKGHDLSEKTKDLAVPLLLIQYYTNPCAHFLVNLSFLSLTVESMRTTITRDILYEKFQFLRSLFSYEFVFDGDTEKEDFERAIELSRQLETVSESESVFYLGKNSKLSQFCKNFMDLYVSSYLIAMDVLLNESTDILLEKDVLRLYQANVESLLTKGCFIHPACLSLDLIANALQAFVLMGAVKKLKSDDETSYEVYEDLTRIKALLETFHVVPEERSSIENHLNNFVIAKL